MTSREFVRLRHPDVVVPDVRTPGTGRIESRRAIIAAEARSHILTLTTFDLDEYAFGTPRLGAGAFIVKDVVPSGFVVAIRRVADGDAIIALGVTRCPGKLGLRDRVQAVACAHAGDLCEISG